MSQPIVLPSSAELTSVRVKTRNADIDITTIGSGRPLMFLHGTEGPIFPSDKHLHELARSFRVIAPWHPGFGSSDLPKHFSSVDDLAYFYLDLADALGLSDAVLMGSAFGGWIAAEMIVRSSSRFSHLILVDAFGVKAGERETRDIVDMYAVSRAELARLSYVEPAFQEIDLTSRPMEDLLKIARSREALTLFGWRPYMHNPQLKNWLHRIDLPTLVMWGDGDRVVSRDCGHVYRNAIPNAAFELVENAGHFPYIERPEHVASSVAKFVQSH